MLKPLDLPLRVRFWHFLRGLLFYNTVYWKRASDELKPPTLTREERSSYRPAPDRDIVRPRERPRAHVPTAQAATGDHVNAPAPVAGTLFPATAARESTVSPVAPATPREMPPTAADGKTDAPAEKGVIVKRRRYRRRRNHVRTTPHTDPPAQRSGGVFAWLTKGKERR